MIHQVSMRLEREEIVEEGPDYQDIVEWLTPDPAGPYIVTSSYSPPTWAKRRIRRPKPLPSQETGCHD